MRRPARVLTLLAAAAFALAPAFADARPGGGFSSGSRGARTYSAPPSTSTAPSAPRQMDRTTTQRPSPPAAAPGSMRPQPAGGGFFSRNPIMGGLMLGLFGAGLFGLLGGAGFFAGLGSIAGLFGFLIQIALIVGLVMLVRNLLRRRAEPVPAGVPGGLMRTGLQPVGGGSGSAAPVAIVQADYQQFEALLRDVNAAWSRGDMATLGRLATPEMAQYFRDDLAALAARGWTNETRDVRLEQGDLSEAWREGARDYATVAMRFSLVDVTRDVATGRVTEGDPNARTQATELWTFVRSQGGPWQLSAIQQTR